MDNDYTVKLSINGNRHTHIFVYTFTSIILQFVHVSVLVFFPFYCPVLYVATVETTLRLN